MPYNVAANMQFAKPVSAFLDARDNVTRNALAERQVANVEQNTAFNQQRLTATDQIEAQRRQQEQDAEEGKQLFTAMSYLNNVANNPEQFAATAQQMFASPKLAPIFQKHQVLPEDVTPQNVQELLAATGASVGQGPESSATKVQSAQILANGNIGYLTSDGKVVDTGQKAKESLQVITAGGVPGIANLRTQGFSPLSTVDAEASAAATKAAAEAGAKTTATNEADFEKQQRQNQMSYDAYSKGMSALEKAMAGTKTDPVTGRVVAVTAAAQVAEGSAAIMAPILKQLFRSAGEGTFTDRDQALLMDMLPTRKDHPEARKAKIQMINDIVKAKLGIGGATAPVGNRIKVDADGNVVK